jgi:hypothetical protein
MGTAVRFEKAPGSLGAPSGKPFTSDLSGRDLFQAAPLRLGTDRRVMSGCVCHIAHQSIRQTLRQAGQNVEIPQCTQAAYSARELPGRGCRTTASAMARPASSGCASGRTTTCREGTGRVRRRHASTRPAGPPRAAGSGLPAALRAPDMARPPLGFA